MSVFSRILALTYMKMKYPQPACMPRLHLIYGEVLVYERVDHFWVFYVQRYYFGLWISWEGTTILQDVCMSS